MTEDILVIGYRKKLFYIKTKLKKDTLSATYNIVLYFKKKRTRVNFQGLNSEQYCSMDASIKSLFNDINYIRIFNSD